MKSEFFPPGMRRRSDWQNQSGSWGNAVSHPRGSSFPSKIYVNVKKSSSALTRQVFLRRNLFVVIRPRRKTPVSHSTEEGGRKNDGSPVFLLYFSRNTVLTHSILTRMSEAQVESFMLIFRSYIKRTAAAATFSEKKRYFACQRDCYSWHGAPFNVPSDGQ